MIRHDDSAGHQGTDRLRRRRGSADADVSRVVAAMKAGAFDFLKKPYDQDRFEKAVNAALDWDVNNLKKNAKRRKIERRLASLKPGERDVLGLLLKGGSNRRIAEKLDLSIRTIEVRRAKLMTKMKARSLAELIRLVMAAPSFGG